MRKPYVNQILETYDQAPIGIGILELNGHWKHVNSVLCDMVGYSEAELLNTTFMEITHPDDLYRDVVYMDQLLAGQIRSYELNKRFIQRQGSLCWVSWDVSYAASFGSEAPCFMVYVKEITERKLAEQMMKETEQRYQFLFDHDPDMKFSLWADGQMVCLNHACEEVIGYTAGELFHIDQLLDPASRERVRRSFDKTINGFPQTYEIHFKHKTGKAIELKIIQVPWNGNSSANSVYCIAKDMTEINMQKRALEESEARYRLITENSLDMIVRCAADFTVLYVSPASEFLLGYEPAELIGKPGLYFVHPDDTGQLINTYNNLDKVQLYNRLTFRLMKKNGDALWVEAMNRIIRDAASGNINEIISVFRDITEHRKQQERLRVSEELYKLISDNAQDCIAYITPDGICRYVSPSIRNLLGYEPEEFVGVKCIDYFHPEDKDIWGKTRLFSLPDVKTLTCRLRHKNGSYIWLESVLKVIRNERGRVKKILGVSRDISERMEAQELLKASEKLNIAGQLAAGIAHEIRNPLTSLKGFLKLIQSGAGGKQQHFDIMREEIDRIEMIVSELLVLARPEHVSAFRQIDLSLLLKQVITLLESQAIMNNVEIHASFPKEPLYVIGDHNQLKQVYINVIKNAIEAMLDGGVIRIEASKKDELALISIADQGNGIPQENISKIGEPFYTTKQSGNGLGLMVSYKIIKHHGGQIHIYSEQGKGATFEISIPSVPSHD